jgi:ABC-2 type transport system permease protein
MRIMLRLVFKDILIGIIGSWMLIFFWFILIFIRFPFVAITAIISLSLINNSLGFDEKSKIDPLYSSLPIQRSTYVLSKYLSTFSIWAGVLLLTFLAQLILSIFIFPGFLREITIRDILYLLFPLTILISMYFPVYFKVGGIAEKIIPAVAIVFSVAICIGILGILAVASTETDNFTLLNFKHIYLYLIGIMILFLAISIGLSLKFFTKRDLL